MPTSAQAAGGFGVPQSPMKSVKYEFSQVSTFRIDGTAVPRGRDMQIALNVYMYVYVFSEDQLHALWINSEMVLRGWIAREVNGTRRGDI